MKHSDMWKFFLVLIFISLSITGAESNSKKKNQKNSLKHPHPFEACNMLIAIDERLYNHFNKDLENVTTMANNLVEKMNKVYQK